ncbi:hypothetical protein [Petrimonas sp.]|uniref:hypothetical protein n=1 Tax=Petrimonas sp. TaxID=2023866 RepID=UPI003F515F03
MERIVLEVDGATARKWRTSSYRLRSQLNRLLGEQINQIIDRSEPEDSIRFFEELRAEMKEKGLTQEVLDSILHEKE